jgi:hypothetical protein
LTTVIYGRTLPPTTLRALAAITLLRLATTTWWTLLRRIIARRTLLRATGISRANRALVGRFLILILILRHNARKNRIEYHCKCCR